jgi:hypothetical protein
MSWHACALPPAGLGDALPRRREALAHQVEAPVTVPAEDHPPWTDDRAWIARWRQVGPTLPEREPVVRAWLAAAPPQPLSRRLAAIELARIAREHGIVVEVEPVRGHRLEPAGELVDILAEERPTDEKGKAA